MHRIYDVRIVVETKRGEPPSPDDVCDAIGDLFEDADREPGPLDRTGCAPRFVGVSHHDRRDRWEQTHGL